MPEDSSRGVAARLMRPLAIALVGGVAILSFGVFRHGSLSAAIARLQGYPLFVESPSIALGEVVAGQKAAACFSLRNLKAQQVTIVGAKASCGCMVASNLPLTIKGGGEGKLVLEFSERPRDIGSTRRNRVLLYLDVPTPPIVLEVTARVVESPSDEGQSAEE